MSQEIWAGKTHQITGYTLGTAQGMRRLQGQGQGSPQGLYPGHSGKAPVFFNLQVSAYALFSV